MNHSLSRLLVACSALLLLVSAFGIAQIVDNTTCWNSGLRIIARKGAPYCNGYGDTAHINQACHTDCDTCCNFYIDVINTKMNTQIKELQFCVVDPVFEKPCRADSLQIDTNLTKNCDLWHDSDPSPTRESGQDSTYFHICNYCGTTLVPRIGGILPWFEYPDCFRLFPFMGSATVCNSACLASNLCRFDCVHTFPATADFTGPTPTPIPDPNRYAGFRDTLRTNIGFAGVKCDTSNTFCIRVWAKIDSAGTQITRCCILNLPRCQPCFPTTSYWPSPSVCGTYFHDNTSCLDPSTCNSPVPYWPWYYWRRRKVAEQGTCDTLFLPKRVGEPVAPAVGPDLGETVRSENGSLIFIATMAEPHTAIVVISDAAGQQVYQRNVLLANGENRLPDAITNVPSGAYFLSVVFDGISETLPFTIVK